MMPPLHANTERLWDSLMQMARIGATPNGGCCRLVLTDEDKQARDLFVAWCKDAGCGISIDGVGNIFARRPGRDPARPPVLSGSHLDTQPHGGRFDGVYGVLAALEVIRSLNDAGLETEAAIEAVVWSNEEGVRYNPGMLGSGVFAGAHRIEDILVAEDQDGRRYGDELKRIGYDGDATVGGRALDSFFEVHIEQGPVLESEGKTIGIVGGVQGYRTFDVVVTGQDSHAGTTPMDLRRDALNGAAAMLLRLEAIGAVDPAQSRITVGHLQVIPNAPSTIPGCVLFHIDMRNPSTTTMAEQEQQLRDGFRDIAAARGLAVEMRPCDQLDPVSFDAGCAELLRGATSELGYPQRDMLSGAMHDACHLAGLAPTAMLFVPCKDGLSHNEAESADATELGAGCSVLLNAILARAS